MRTFTDSPFEKMMMQIPRGGKYSDESRHALPESGLCNGCSASGNVCARPCWREKKQKAKESGKNAPDNR